MQLPDCVRDIATALHESVRLTREGAAHMGADLSDFTDLEVYAIMHFCNTCTPSGMRASTTMVGLIGMMKGGNR